MIYSLGEVPYEAVPNQFRTPEFHYYLMYRYEFKDNHGEWITAVKPELGPAISERVWEAVRTTGENVDACHSVKTELHAALATLLQVPLSCDYKAWIYLAKEEIIYLESIIVYILLGYKLCSCSVMSSLHLQDFGILAIPTVSGLPPKLQTDPTTLKIFRAKAFGLLSIAGVSGFCQVLYTNEILLYIVLFRTSGLFPYVGFLPIYRLAYR
jgi:hypothetical protein